VGVDTTYFRLTNLALASGRRSLRRSERRAPLAIAAMAVRTRSFTTEDPHRPALKVGESGSPVVGVLQESSPDAATAQRLGIRDANDGRLRPWRTVLIRSGTAQLTQRDIEQAARQVTVTTKRRADRSPSARRKRNQPQPARPDHCCASPNRATCLGRRRPATQCRPPGNNTVVDFEIRCGVLLRRSRHQDDLQRRARRDRLHSLVVGGIGIMNIMLASVLDGSARSGAPRNGRHPEGILFQFLSEAVLISVAGGLVGILVGVAVDGIERFAESPRSCHPCPVSVAFGCPFTWASRSGSCPLTGRATGSSRCLR